MLRNLWGCIAALVLMLPAPVALSDDNAAQGATLVVGSKLFGESYLLAEIASQWLRHEGFTATHRQGLGGTLIVYSALREGDVDIYPEYSGTLAQAVLQTPDASPEMIDAALAAQQLQRLGPLGFSNSYAMAMQGPMARELGITRISDLARHPGLRLGFSLEFLQRNDGWQALRGLYQLPHTAIGIEHALAYPAIAAGQLDLTDAYVTDGELPRYDLVLLQDDLEFFPDYSAAFLARQDLPAAARDSLQILSGRITAGQMRSLNRRLADRQGSAAELAADFLRTAGLIDPAQTGPLSTSASRRILGHTLRHIQLTGAALFLAIALGIPAALLVVGHPRVSAALIYLTGLLQTIPALALLALLIPVLGLGLAPAILALFLYSLLPILRNTVVGIRDVDPLLLDVATGMGLTPWQRLRHIELPLAWPTLLAGIKTAGIISIGTATLAAFVGAGGLGQPIITGLTLNDHRMILEGAIPAALLAIMTELGFGLLDRKRTPPTNSG